LSHFAVDFDSFIKGETARPKPKGVVMPPIAPHAAPQWNVRRRELSVDNHIIKCFRQPARNQELILAVFQEENWPTRIDNPLPADDGDDGAERLKDAVRRLNDQRMPRLRSLRDGRGEGVLWEHIETPKPTTRCSNRGKTPSQRRPKRPKQRGESAPGAPPERPLT
jgi:hypothetical protein